MEQDQATLNGDQPFSLAEWLVDPASGTVSRDGEAVMLEPRVMSVLVYLAQRAGRVITRQELEEAVWQDRVVSYDALTSAIQKLRKALGDDARQHRIIETRSKRGYRLVATVTPLTATAQAPLPPTVSPEPKRRQRVTTSMVVAGAATVALLAIIAWVGLGRDASRLHPDKGFTPPSIAVLPFQNLSGEREQDYFAEGITDDLITELAKHSDLFVIARDSTFMYKSHAEDVGAIAQKLDARYVLRGSVQRASEQLRVNVQLVDAATGGHLWAEHYDGEVQQIFALEDEIVRQVVASLASRDRDGAATRRTVTKSNEAYDQFLRGRKSFFLYASKEENRKARELYRKAIELDPDFAMAYAMLAYTHVFDAMNGWSDVRDESLQRAQDLANQAIALDSKLPVAYFVTGLVYRERSEYIKALVEAEKAIKLDPSYANAHVLLATLFYYTGRPREGLERIQTAMRLNPHYPYNYPFHLGQAYFVLKEYDKAIAALEQGLQSNPAEERMRVWLAAAYAEAGRLDEARWEAEQVHALNPEFSPQRIQEAFPFKDPRDLELFIDGLSKAGLVPGKKAESS